MERGIFRFLSWPRTLGVIGLALFAASVFWYLQRDILRHELFGESCEEVHAKTGADARCVTIYFATPRNLVGAPGAAEDGFESVNGFGMWYSNKLTYGRAEVTLPHLVSEDRPQGRKRGVVDHATGSAAKTGEDTEKYVALTTISKASSQTAFYDSLKDAVGENENDVLLFVHGFNVNFDTAVIRTAQLAVDLTYDETLPPDEQRFEFGQPVLFTWPNFNSILAYPLDRVQAYLSAKQMELFLDELTARTDAKSINIIVHSMGNRVLVRALKEFVKDYSNTANDDIDFKIIHAAADIENGFYDKVMDEISKSQFKADYTLYASRDDFSFSLAKIILIGKLIFPTRIGQILNGKIYIRENQNEKDVVTSIDATGFATDLFGHGYFSNAGNIISDISCNLYGVETSGRALARREADDGREYWEADSSICRCGVDRVRRFATSGAAARGAIASGGAFFDRRPQGGASPDDPGGYGEPAGPPSQFKLCEDDSSEPVSDLCMITKPGADTGETPAPVTFTVYFDYKSTALTDEARETIADYAQRILQYNIYEVVVIGYADAVGPDEYNLALSQRRAEAVAGALVDAGVPNDLIYVEARGEEESDSEILARRTDEESDRNRRRVEVVVEFE